MGRLGSAALVALSLAAACAKEARRPVEDVIPLTVGNLRGHRMLYNEGWLFVTSSRRAFQFAKERSIDSSRTAVQRVLEDAARRTGEVPGEIASDAKASLDAGKSVLAAGTKTTGRILNSAQESATSELRVSEAGFQKAFESLVRGNLAIVSRTQDDRRELLALPGGYFKDLRDDFSNVHAEAEVARRSFEEKIGPAWEGSFQRASAEFRAGYENSGRQQNSLLALGPILYGDLAALSRGLLEPASKALVRGVVIGSGLAVVSPVAAATVVTERTVESIGLTVYYAGKTGVHVLSPTVEGGLLGAFALLAATPLPATYAAGGAVGAVNQVACTIAAPAAAVAEETARTAYHAAAYAGLLTYDALAGTTQATINQGGSGLVLGYNALTAIPVHALMGSADVAVFLAWDGPRLLIAAAQGKVRSGTKDYSLGDLPVGTVVDLKKLKQSGDVEVKALSVDPAVIEEVLEKLSVDLRQSDEAH